ncbi:HD domain-containing protein [Gehongia tenuis]|uniref:HD domain-containing protein n=1 Tax=Gehongia tenuis TaxID=2763655 RepID=A0A926HK10_9FIRM|nr:HD domain-containing protein [Gehongia tenuis]MBC8530462.1 HD domain-containing protein [Gehongia tenuis]
MKRSDYGKLEAYMLECMGDSAHDGEHVYRVLHMALFLAEDEDVNRDVLIAAALLHDIGRAAELRDGAVDHAQRGSEMARTFLSGMGFDKDFAEHVAACIATHRYRSGFPPASREAEILFDADKLDVTGALGVARTFLYQGAKGRPIYTVENGRVQTGREADDPPSFLREYHFKLKHVEERLFTERARRIADERQKAAWAYYEELVREIGQSYGEGQKILDELT